MNGREEEVVAEKVWELLVWFKTQSKLNQQNVHTHTVKAASVLCVLCVLRSGPSGSWDLNLDLNLINGNDITTHDSPEVNYSPSLYPISPFHSGTLRSGEDVHRWK